MLSNAKKGICGVEMITKDFKENQNFVAIRTLTPEEVTKHCEPNIFFDLALWLITLNAKRSNLRKAKKILAKQYENGKNLTLKKVLWNMGRDSEHFSHIFADRYSKLNHDVKVYAASWRALEIFYNFHNKYKPNLKSTFGDILTYYWIGVMRNGQAVTNRKDIVVNMLLTHISQCEDEVPRIVSLASGSAQAVVEAVQQCGRLVQVKLLDSDVTAIEASKKMVEQARLSDQFEFIKTRIDPRVIRRHCKQFEPHIVEMVGLMDYFNDEWAIRIIAEIKTHISSKGMFITCNINNAYSIEKEALDWVSLWPMLYRTPKEFSYILVEGWFNQCKFKPNKIKITYDSFNIHGVAQCFV